MQANFKKVFLLHELKLLWANKHDYLQPIFFFLMVLSFFPLAISVSPSQLALLFPGLFCITMLLSHLLSLSSLFQQDYEDGTLMQWLIQPEPLTNLIRIKLFCHILLFMFSMFLLIPMGMVLYHIPFVQAGLYFEVTFLAVPSITILGATASALTVALKKGFLLLSLLVIPFYIPILLFSTLALEKNMHGLNNHGELALLLASGLATIVILPNVISNALRFSIAQASTRVC